MTGAPPKPTFTAPDCGSLHHWPSGLPRLEGESQAWASCAPTGQGRGSDQRGVAGPCCLAAAATRACGGVDRPIPRQRRSRSRGRRVGVLLAFVAGSGRHSVFDSGRSVRGLEPVFARQRSFARPLLRHLPARRVGWAALAWPRTPLDRRRFCSRSRCSSSCSSWPCGSCAVRRRLQPLDLGQKRAGDIRAQVVPDRVAVTR